jgi:hypothetical protein
MELTWIAVLASLLMAAAAVCVFIFAVKKDYFRNIEDAKYQVFWSDLEDGPLPSAALPLAAVEEKRHDGGSAKSR